MSAYSLGGGWLNDQSPATGASSSLTRAVRTNALAVGLGLLTSAGTGATVSDIQLLQLHRQQGASISSWGIPVVESLPSRTAAEDIERIREVLSPSVSELAGVFHVSRQTLYNWLNGESPSPERMARVQEVAQAADLIAESGVRVTGALMKRKVREGRSVLETAREGGSVYEAAQMLVQIARHEAEQRQRMSARLAGRQTASRSVESEFPAENDMG